MMGNLRLLLPGCPYEGVSMVQVRTKVRGQGLVSTYVVNNHSIRIGELAKLLQ